jgi:hypothetical protein
MRQIVVYRSSAKAEYHGIANATVKCHWLKHLLQELYVDVHKATVIYCDNVSVVYLSYDLVHHRWTQHAEIDIHFVHELVALDELCVVHVPTDLQYMDIMIKSLPQAIFDKFKISFHAGEATTQTAGGVSHVISPRILAPLIGMYLAHTARYGRLRRWP